MSKSIADLTREQLDLQGSKPNRSLADLAFAGAGAEPFNGTWGDLIKEGEEVFDRDIVAQSNMLFNANGRLMLALFTARKTETISRLKILGGGTAAVGITNAWMCIYKEDEDTGALTLVAQTQDDPTLFSVASTAYIRNLMSAFEKVRGRRYGMGVMYLGATTHPGFRAASSAMIGSELAESPRLAGASAGLTSLPATIANPGQDWRRIYGVLLP